MEDKTSPSPVEAAEAARKLWLTATCQSDLDEVERLYRWALSTKTQHPCQPTKSADCLDRGDGEVDGESDDGDGPPKKRTKPSGEGCGLNRVQFNQVGEKYALLLCQSGRCKKAEKGLSSMGFTCRLAEQVLDYPSDNDCNSTRDDSVAINENRRKSAPPCQIIDGFLSTLELERLRLVFESPAASYWTDHQYAVEPPSPYFSYVIPLERVQKSGKGEYGFIGNLAQKITSCPLLNERFPKLRRNAKFVELWAHNRPHASGHQMHFDSDDEGRGGIRNPIISTILYVTAEDIAMTKSAKPTGGPSLVTNQKLTDIRVATQGWIAHPRPQRLVAFDGRCLHGVVPGKSFREGRRVTLMMAFWEDIRIRRGVGHGSARPFPTRTNNNPLWANQLVSPLANSNNYSDYESCVETDPITLDTIYEKLDGRPWKRGMGMPSYDEVFQGF